MKVYYIENKNSHPGFFENMQHYIEHEIEKKNKIDFKINKSDYVIALNIDDDFEQFKKINNLIVLTEMKDRHSVFKLVSSLKAKDFIYLGHDELYPISRVKRALER